MLEVRTNVDRRMITFFSPTVFLLHEGGHARVFVIANCRVYVFDEVLRTLSCFIELSVKTVILYREWITYLRIRFSFFLVILYEYIIG